MSEEPLNREDDLQDDVRDTAEDTITEKTAKRALLRTRLQPNSIDYMIEFYRIIQEGRARRISKTVETILGRKPISFKIFARDHAELFKSRIELKVIGQ